VDRTVDLAAIAKLRDWIAATRKQPVEIDLDTDLVEAGVLDSLQMVSFILYVSPSTSRRCARSTTRS
jgi:acyl carrier protein